MGLLMALMDSRGIEEDHAKSIMNQHSKGRTEGFYYRAFDG